MSQLVWYAEPAEIAVGMGAAPVTILVGLAEVEGHGDSLTMVIHSENLDVVLSLTDAQAEELGSVLSGIGAELRSIGGAE